MFISSFEKQKVFSSIKSMEEVFSSIKSMEERILALEAQLKGKEPKQKKRRGWSEEERARASARMREFHARRRAEKIAA